MRCAGFLCDSLQSDVVKTIRRSMWIRRYRQCKKCGIYFVTEERKIVKKFPISRKEDQN
jgi:transcriptional regulator NrdR family protein